MKLSTKKGCTTWELWVKFYLGQNEDCSPGSSISDSSARLLQSNRVEKSIYKVLVKGKFNTMKHSIYKRFLVIHEDLMSPWRDLVLLWIWRREMATHSSVLAWRIPGTGEPGRLPSMGSHRVGHDWSHLAAADMRKCKDWVHKMCSLKHPTI